jgi:hypothetical protein
LAVTLQSRSAYTRTISLGGNISGYSQKNAQADLFAEYYSMATRLVKKSNPDCSDPTPWQMHTDPFDDGKQLFMSRL